MVDPIVIKFGGSLLENKSMRKVFLGMLAEEWKIQQDPAFREKRAPILLVHGGGKDITRELEKQNIPARFEGGRRYTDKATMIVVESVLERVNKAIVDELHELGAKAYGLCGKSNALVRAKPCSGLGLVGVPDDVNEKALAQVLKNPGLPVLYSIAVGHNGETMNINADDFAQELAITSQASHLIFMTDSGGIKDKSGKIIEIIASSEVERLIANGTITDGMAVKSRACVAALKRGVAKVTIAHQVELATASPPRAVGTSFVK